MPDDEDYGGGYGETVEAFEQRHGIPAPTLTPSEGAVIGAAREWRAARTDVLAGQTVTRAQYDRLARAEGALSDAVRLLEREGQTRA